MSAPTSPTVLHAPATRRYEIHADGELAGTLEYEEQDGVRHFVSTKVEPRFGGRGLAKQLVREALDDVRANGLRVRPVCSYVTRFLDENAEYADIDARAAAS